MVKEKDLKLVMAVNDNNADAFKLLFDRHWNRIYHLALKKLPAEEDASDVTQEVFYIIWRNRGYLDVTKNFGAYLNSMLRHKIYDFYAHKNKLPVFIPLDEHEDYWDENFQNSEVEDYIELNQLINQEVQAMPEKMREVFLLSRYENLTAQQISEKLGISVQTVRNQISTALKRLKNRFGNKLAWLLLLYFL